MRRESGSALGTRGLLVFSIGEILFGVSVEETAGLIEADRIAPLPRRCGPVAGVLAFRGAMVPAVDFGAWLDSTAASAGATRYGIVLSRGTERFALLIPSIPRLVPGRELKASDETIADGELSSVIGAVYLADGERIHVLRCWTIFDSVMPEVPAGSEREPVPSRGDQDDF